MKTNKFSLMGKIVTVNAQYKRLTNKEDGKIWRVWEQYPISPRAGWVTGYRYLQNGIYNKGYYSHSYYDEEGHDSGPYLSIKEVVPCLLVAFHPTMKSVRVPLGAFELGGEPSKIATSWSEKDRSLLRGWMKEVPRDSKGRWLKC